MFIEDQYDEYLAHGICESQTHCNYVGYPESSDAYTTETSISRLIEYTAQAVDNVESLREEVNRLNSIIIDLVRNKDVDKQGLFHCGKLLCEGINCTPDEEQGLKMIQKAASGKNESAGRYLIDYYTRQEDWEKVLEYRRSLYDVGYKEQLVDFLVEHPSLHRSCKKLFGHMISDGCLKDECISSKSKIGLVNMYIQSGNRDVAVIAENLPDDDTLLDGMKSFFELLPSSSRNDDVQYFIGYNYLFGMSHPSDNLKGIDIMYSLKGRITRQYAPSKATNRDEFVTKLQLDGVGTVLKIVVIGGSATGKTFLLCKIIGQKYEWQPHLSDNYVTYLHRGRKTITLDFVDTPGCDDLHLLCQMEIAKCMCVAIFYDATDASSCNIDDWYNLARTDSSERLINPVMPILVVQTKCDLDDVDAIKRVDTIKQWCADKEIMHCRTSAKEEIGISEFIDAVCDLGMIGLERRRMHDMEKRGLANSSK